MIEFAPGLWRGPRPNTDDLRHQLVTAGIQTIVNLEGGLIERLTGDQNADIEFAVGMGMRHYHLEMNLITPPSHDAAHTAIEILQRTEFGPVYLHCKQGVDRTGYVVAAFRLMQGVPFAAAVAEMKAAGMHRWYWWWSDSLAEWAAGKPIA